MTTWVKDDRGNKCSVEFFGSKEAAQKALDSLRAQLHRADGWNVQATVTTGQGN